MARKKETPPRMTEDERILQEAKERFARCESWESTARARYVEDVKFYNGDSENKYQWPFDVQQNRETDRRPMLTINRTRQFCLNITNDAKQNKASMKVRPVGNRATYQGAQVMEGILRHIEYQSNAQACYDKATESQVQGGVGYWRVVTDYADKESFDQEIYIRWVKDPLSVYVDPDCSHVDRSDARFAFVFDDIPRERFDAEHPTLKDQIGAKPSIGSGQDWLTEKHVRIAEYYRRTENMFKLVAMTDPNSGEVKIVRGDKVPKEVLDMVLADKATKTRDVVEHKVEWFKIAGDQIIDRKEWAGTTIPVVQIVGEESVIEGKMDRKGHVRAIKDPNRMYNYWSSSAVEAVALQSKAPFIGSARAIEGYEAMWGSANTENFSTLTYNDVGDDGSPIQAPQRQQPPVMPQAYMQGLQLAAEEMRMVTGQYQSDMGEPGNEQSGKAINARQRQGDMATYHFIDNQAVGIRYTGRILLDLIPKIYDTKRIIKILGEDGVESEVTIDPSAKREYEEQRQQEENRISIIFNPGFAKYSVEADIGPAYATRRQEAFNAFTQIMAQNPDLMKVAGDLMFRAADFPMADELAERLKRLVPPAVLGKGPDPQVQQLLQENQTLKGHLATLMTQYAEKSTDQSMAERKANTDDYNAETQRLKTLLGTFDPKLIASMMAQLVLESQNTHLGAAPAQLAA